MAATADHSLQQATLDVEGMTCASCVAHVEKAVKRMPGVQNCQVDLARGRAAVRFDSSIDANRIAQAISDAGYPAHVPAPDVAAKEAEALRVQRHEREAGAWRRRAIAGLILWLPVELIHWGMRLAGSHIGHHPAQATWFGWLTVATGSASLLYIGSRFYSSALAALRHRTTNMDTLISLGASVAYGYSLAFFIGGMAGLWDKPTAHQLYFMEASALLALISLGHWLEARARQSAGAAVRQLLELTPDVARRQRSSPNSAEPEFEEITLAQVDVGDRLLVRPGDRAPIDGVVVDGVSSVDESMITGESLPVARKVGDSIIGGTLNIDGRLLIRVTRTGSETALAQIVALVESAQSNKPPVQKLADRISAVFVPCVLGIALATGVAWFAIGSSRGWNGASIWGTVARNVCSVLIIACPCALGLAVPAAVMVGVGRGARRGILIRDIDALQKAERINAIVFDKTGTLTRGKPAVANILSINATPIDEILRLAASAEQFSSHPLAKAIVVHARQRGIKLAQPTSFANSPGGGVEAELDNTGVVVGSRAFLADKGIEPDESLVRSPAPGHSEVWVAAGFRAGLAAVGIIDLADEIKLDSASAIAELKRMNLRVVMLSGDNQIAAQAVASQLGIDEVHAEVKPAGKANAINALRSGGQFSVAMVGDGINDAPALASADLGIAIGGGSDVAREAGDIVLVGSSVSGAAEAIRLSRLVMRKIRQNLFLALIYNLLAIPLAACGLLNPAVAAAAMALSDLSVVGNALSMRVKQD